MLTGKTAVVTGGTRGIGFAIAKKFLENGANVAIAGSRQESVDKALAKLPEYAGRVMGIWPDICSPEEVAAAFELSLRRSLAAWISWPTTRAFLPEPACMTTLLRNSPRS